MAFAGEGGLGKLRNEDKKAFDILFRKRGAALVQQQCRIISKEEKIKERRGKSGGL